MKMTIDVWDMRRAFHDMDRDYYSVCGLDSLLEFYNEIDENMEFDPVAICCDCTEYGDFGAACSFNDLISDYKYKLDVEEWMQENDIDDFEVSKTQYIKALTEVLQDETTVLFPENGNIIVFAF